MDVVLKKLCWKYHVPDECYRASDWSALESGTAATLTVMSGGTTVSSTLQIKELSTVEHYAGKTITTQLTASLVHRTVDSQRYFVLLVPASASETGVSERVGIGFRERDESKQFVAAVLRCAGINELPEYNERVAASAMATELAQRAFAVSPPPSPSTRDPTGADSGLASPALRIADHSSGSEDEDDAVVTVGTDSDARSVRGTVPDLRMDDGNTIQAQHAAVSPGPQLPAAAAAATTTSQKKKESEEQKQQEQEEEEQQRSGERKHSREDNTMEVWRKHKKHVFVVSIAGKPIYSRYGDEQNLAPFMASLSAMVSFVEDSHDVLHYFVAGEHQMVFLLRGPLIIAAMCCTRDTRADVVRVLDYVHAQIVSVLTTSSINKIYEQRPDFDLRGLLTGTDRLIDNLVGHMNCEPGFAMHALRPLVMPASDRRNVAAAFERAACPELLFALLVHGFSLVHMARPKKFVLDAKDVHLLMNFVHGSASFRMSRTWTPICLPTFDDRGFLHAFICFLPNGACLVLLSAHVDAFYRLNSCADAIIGSLAHTGAMAAITRAVEAEAHATHGVCVGAVEAAAPALRHFVYRSNKLRQLVVPRFERPYDTHSARKRLLRVYQRARDQALTGTTLHANVLQPPRSHKAATAAPDPAASGELAHRIFYQVSSHETVLLWLYKDIELVAAFTPFESKARCHFVAKKIHEWVTANMHDLFVLDMPTW